MKDKRFENAMNKFISDLSDQDLGNNSLISGAEQACDWAYRWCLENEIKQLEEKLDKAKIALEYYATERHTYAKIILEELNEKK